jgi:hypothetical protein
VRVVQRMTVYSIVCVLQRRISWECGYTCWWPRTHPGESSLTRPRRLNQYTVIRHTHLAVG